MDTSNSNTYQESTVYNMDKIKGISWAKTMFEILDYHFKKSFINWLTIVIAMSDNEADIEEWKSLFIEHFTDRCAELVSDIKEHYDEVQVNAEKYLKRIQDLCEILQIEMPIFGQTKHGLYQETLCLKTHLNELEQLLKSRQDNINKLRHKELLLCQLLEMEPRIINDDPLPSPIDISEFEKYIEQLEQEQFNREEQFLNIKGRLTQIIEELDYVPNTKFERDVMFANESNFVLTKTNMESLNNFHTKMEQKLKQVREDIDQLRNKVEQLWTLLDLELRKREDFSNKNRGYSLKVMKSLQVELQRCERLKQANIKVFIIKLRQDLEEIWEKCQCSETVKKEFNYFYSDCFSDEDLLELHEVQLKKWRTYAEENKETLNLLNKHKQLWNKKLQLEESARGPDRYSNRGGKLLQEEKERNILAKQIPEIEKTLMILAKNYEARYNTPFLTYGESIGTYINNLHATRDNTKKLKLSARKAKKDVKLTSVSNTGCSSTISPSAIISYRAKDFHLVNTKKNEAPEKALGQDKKRRINLLQLPKITVSNFSSLATINRSKRLSTERKKRIEKIRQQDRSRDSGNSTYLEFKSFLMDKKNNRSTMNFSSVENLSEKMSPVASSTHYAQNFPKNDATKDVQEFV